MGIGPGWFKFFGFLKVSSFFICFSFRFKLPIEFLIKIWNDILGLEKYKIFIFYWLFYFILFYFFYFFCTIYWDFEDLNILIINNHVSFSLHLEFLLLFKKIVEICKLLLKWLFTWNLLIWGILIYRLIIFNQIHQINCPTKYRASTVFLVEFLFHVLTYILHSQFRI